MAVDTKGAGAPTPSRPWGLAARVAPPLLLALLLVALHLVNWAWIQAAPMDVRRVPDSHLHLFSLLETYALLALQGVRGVLSAVAQLNGNHSLTSMLPLALTGHIWGYDLAVMRAGNLVYLALLVGSVYYLGAALGDRRTGLLAAALTGLTPGVYGGARVLGVDMPAAAMISLALAALHWCRGFSRPGPCLAFGALVGLATLVRNQAPLVLIWPTALLFGQALLAARRQGTFQLLKSLTKGALVVLSTLLITSPWWMGRISNLWSILTVHVTGEGMETLEGDPSLWGGVTQHLAELPLLLGGPLALALLPLAILALVRPRGPRPWLVLAWAAGPLLWLMSSGLRHHRYMLPLAPAMALLLALGTAALPGRLLRRAVATGLLLAAVAGWLLCSLAPAQPRLQEPISHDPTRLWAPWRLHWPAHPAVLCSCGSETYAGAPILGTSPHDSPGVRRLFSALGRRHPAGQGACLYLVGPGLAETILVGLEVLPRLLVLENDPLSDLTSAQASPGCRRYLLTPDLDAPDPRRPPAPGATLLYNSPAGQNGEPWHLTLWSMP